MRYDTARFISPIPRRPGWHDVRATVRWSPHDGQPVTVSGAFLDAESPTGEVFLGCGVEGILEALSLWDEVSGHLHSVIRAVDVQLRRHPWAVLECPSGRARLELIPAASSMPPWHDR